MSKSKLDQALGTVLRFWFEELQPKQWFNGGDEVDRQIIARFSDLHAQITAAADEELLGSADVALAALIVLDQFSRNMYRGTAKAFGSDVKALRIADGAVARGFDAAVPKERRVFFSLPLEHAEDLALQDRSVALISALGDAELTKYAEAHRDVIREFGRFPHRNAALGRASTEEELAYLAKPGAGF